MKTPQIRYTLKNYVYGTNRDFYEKKILYIRSNGLSKFIYKYSLYTINGIYIFISVYTKIVVRQLGEIFDKTPFYVGVRPAARKLISAHL